MKPKASPRKRVAARKRRAAPKSAGGSARRPSPAGKRRVAPKPAGGSARRPSLKPLDSPALAQPRHGGEVLAVDVSIASGLAASAGRDGSVALWDLATGQSPRAWHAHAGGVRALRFLPDGKRLVSSGADGAVRVWEVGRGACERSFSAHEGWAFRLLLCHGGQWALSGGADGRVKVLDLEHGDTLSTIEAHGRVVSALALSGDERLLATGSGDQSIRLWDLQKGTLVKTVTGHRAEVLALAFSDAARLLASASADGVIRWWTLSGEPVGALEAHGQPVETLAFDRKGHSLWATGWDGTLRVLSMPDGKRVKSLRAHAGGTSALSVDLASSRALTGGTDQLLRLWHCTGPRAIARAKTAAPVTAARLEGGFAIAGDRAGRVYLLRVRG